MPTYGYTRVSTLEQAGDDKASLDVQRATILRAAEENGLTVTKIYEEPGVSGGKPFYERAAGAQLKLALKPGDTLIVSKLDRAFRSASNALDVAEKLKKDGIHLIIVQFGATPVTQNGAAKMFFGMMALVAEFERSTIAERTAEGRAAKKARGGHIGGSTPYGWRKVGTGRGATLVEHPYEQYVIQFARSASRAGLRLAEIEARLKAANLRSRAGTYFTTTQISRMLERAAFMERHPDLENFLTTVYAAV